MNANQRIEKAFDFSADLTKAADHNCNRFARRAILPFSIREAYLRRDGPQRALEVKRS